MEIISTEIAERLLEVQGAIAQIADGDLENLEDIMFLAKNIEKDLGDIIANCSQHR